MHAGKAVIMTEADFGSMIAAVGVPGFLLFIGYKLAVKYRFFDPEPVRRDDVASKLDKLSDKIDAATRASEGEFRTMRDRMTRVETVLEERRGRN